MKKEWKIALIGNPNCGKSSLFNLLSGLSQKVGNFSGVTVEKKSTLLRLNEQSIQLTDFPGTYSIYPNAMDERIVVSALINEQSNVFPDAIIYVSNINKLEKQTLLLTQLINLGFPLIWVLNMADLEKEKDSVNVAELEKEFNIPVVKISSKSKEGLQKLEEYLSNPETNFSTKGKSFYKLNPTEKELSKNILKETQINNEYQAMQLLHHHSWLPFITEEKKAALANLKNEYEFSELRAQVNETMARYDNFTPILKKAIKKKSTDRLHFSDRLDQVITHQIWGPLIFILLMLFVFQAIFSWASYPMDFIDASFGWLSETLNSTLPESWFSRLLTEGILPGVGGVVIFVPQIAILFFLIGLLEEAGYMARAVFIWDKIMRYFGMNGRSLVALISGGACAVPAIMSTRTISNRKERLLTILATPFISCSARIPVYTILIAFVVPATTVFGIFNAQGLAFMALYFTGIIAALGVSLLFHKTLKSEEPSIFAMELPNYKIPSLRDVLLNTWNKSLAFIQEAGKIILMISIVLWFTASHGPGKALQNAEQNAITLSEQQGLNETETANLISSQKLEASYAGIFGKVIEPVIEPLGYDWKIGIALLTSFAAREVFVGTMATIYNIGDSDNELDIRKKMAAQINPITGEKVYNFGTSLSLLIFYIFALQCMSTLAIIRKETGGWKWAIIVFLVALGLAYFGALAAYQFFG